MLHELKITEAHTPVLFTDNISAKFLIANLVMHEKMKHIEIDLYFILDLVMENKLDVWHTPIEDQFSRYYDKII